MLHVFHALFHQLSKYVGPITNIKKLSFSKLSQMCDCISDSVTEVGNFLGGDLVMHKQTWIGSYFSTFCFYLGHSV